jgi:hypothetical protein
MTEEHQSVFWDISWLAVPGADAADLLTILELSEPTPATWHRGIAAIRGDFWDFEADLRAHLARVFLTPPVRGWRLVIGGWFGGSEGDERLEAITQICRILSRRYGQAHAFTTQGRMDFYAWILARDGEVLRHFVWDGGVVVDEGAPVPAEQRPRRPSTLAASVSPLWQPSADMVMVIASDHSVVPTVLDAREPDAPAGLLATTAWGRQHGVPTRPLD